MSSPLCVYVTGESHLAETARLAARLSGFRVDEGHPDIIFAAQDVDDHADLSGARAAFADAYALRLSRAAAAPIVLLSQVPPGTTRDWAGDSRDIYYQVDTIIVQQAVHRMSAPPRIIVGCADKDAPLPLAYQAYVAAHGCMLLKMSYESAELAKCAINYALAEQIKVARDLDRAALEVRASYEDVELALRSDHRIGPHAYLRPGQANAHLNRDVATIAEILTGQARGQARRG